MTNSFDLSQDYFSLFDMALSFCVDKNALSARYLELQKALHPDRYADKSEQEKRLAVQAASMVNMAFQTLKQPLSRAEYILQLQGIDTQSETDTKMQPAFLMMQMEWREALDEAKDLDILDSLTNSVGHAYSDNLIKMEEKINKLDWNGVRNLVRELQFIEKMKSEIALKEEQLEEY